MGPQNLSRRFSDPRSSGGGATVKNCPKQAIFAHFGGPGTIPSRPFGTKFCMEVTIGPQKVP